MPSSVTLPTLFSKAEAASVQVSPLGNHLAWLARVNGVLNLYIAPLPLPPASGGGAAANKIPGARQLTAAVNRDICFYYTFTRDDKRIIYLRETEHGSELYHIYSINLEELDASSPPCASGVDLLANYPQLTCCVGFVGNLQLWLPRTDPSLVILATILYSSPAAAEQAQKRATGEAKRAADEDLCTAV